MALASISIAVKQLLGNNHYGTLISQSAVPVAPSVTTVAADVATLVADGASPTQGHVTTLNTDWTALSAAITAYNAASNTGDVTILWNGSTITHRGQMRSALTRALQAIEAGYGGLAE